MFFSQQTLNLIKYLLFISLFLASFYLSYHQAVQKPLFEGDTVKVEAYPSDTLPHIEFTQQMFNGEKYISHPLWHICVYTLSKLAAFDLKISSAIISSFFLLLWAILIYFTVQTTLGKKLQKLSYTKRELVFLLSTLSLFFILPLVIPPYDHIIVPNINIWHNVTFWTVKPFALLSMLLTFWALKQQTMKLYILATIAIIISIFAKPSFIIMFLPALVLF